VIHTKFSVGKPDGNEPRQSPMSRRKIIKTDLAISRFEDTQ